jgi:sulfur carrier protein
LETSKTDTTISVTVNGKKVELRDETTVSAYIASRDLKERLVVVELNGKILNRSEFPSITFMAGDQIEIVHFVGGG